MRNNCVVIIFDLDVEWSMSRVAKASTEALEGEEARGER